MTAATRPTTRSLARLVAVVPVVGGLAVTGAVARVGPVLVGCAEAASAHHVALVVEHSDGAVITVCVAFGGDSVTGEQLLSDAHQQAGLEYATSGYGGGNGDAVCQIDYEPAQYPSGCWTASSPYWALFVSRGGGAWTESGLGVSSQTFRDGDAEGFRYEEQSDSSPPPSPLGVCPAAAVPTPTPSAAATTPPRSGTGAGRPTPRSSSPTAPATTRAVPTLPAAASPSVEPATNTPTAGGADAALSRGPPPPAASAGSGAWTASALGVGLLLLLLVRLARTRRRASAPPPPL